MSISVLELVCFITAAAAVWLWMDSLRVRELAIQAARAACVAEGMMLLDDTIAISSLKPVRNSDGRVVLQRAYDFDYTDNGNNRIKGGIVMLGHVVIMLNVGHGQSPHLRVIH
jgi:Protein of unknown function (DUF3301)